ncbi:hypothetical protein N657DRAFT_128434 [Parathielavia appendiculata]|uniref:ZZ-type domain-containing protein n=1 Tax=Parathielavia appendiculata TaxID=2587402 RepID=A0AAN6TVA6_9PEZI|nr:hypothetical protein N657DRAFT_128434 [Parathielavia appendiculata]
MASAAQVSPETPITFKVIIDGQTRRFKLPLRDVGINVLESRLRAALDIPADAYAVFERYSDSAAAYVVLDQTKVAVYKQLYRAAKAKRKLKLRVTTTREEEKQGPKPVSVSNEAEEESRPSVEPTDTEREAEQPVVSDPTPATAEESDSEPTPETRPSKAEETIVQSMKEATETPAAPANFAISSPSDVPSCIAACPAMRASYAVCCNSCDRTIPDAHYHCSTCDDGDFDLCQDCVDRGVTCKGPSHWLIKRFVKNGVIINSTTERLAPKPKPKPKAPSPAQAPQRIVPVFNDLLYASIRTCNCCVQELPEVEFVHCTTCPDFDLCRACFAKDRHGHHPKHAFVPVVEGITLETEVSRRLAAGRGQHHHAICDGCDAGITGVRHKCLECPDWDYCSSCIVNAGFIHPGHRFVPIYEPLEYDSSHFRVTVRKPVHYGICCDGPLCSAARTNSTYIVGDRFKCAVCDDTDFCASCEASPANNHNRTHPLIKFKTPVRHVSVTTTGEKENGKQMPTMGDRLRARPSTSQAPASLPAEEPSTPSSLISGVQTVVDVKPSEPVKVEDKQPVQAKEEPAVAAQASTDDLVATFVRDTVEDGTVFGPDHVFEQTWILRNTGKTAWPAGCSVKFVGGDYMGHLDPNHPAATRDVEFSCESTICYAAVQPGEEFPFTVLLRTPSRPGRIVSNWRLTTKEGHRFGHRLWCDVVVEKPKVALPPSDPVTLREEEKLLSELEPEHSQMIFPKLEKESPAASVHEEPKPEAPAPAQEQVKEAEAELEYQVEEEVIEEQYEEYEDCQDDEWDNTESIDGYLTDEEYDILDASDEESNSIIQGKQK